MANAPTSKLQWPRLRKWASGRYLSGVVVSWQYLRLEKRCLSPSVTPVEEIVAVPKTHVSHAGLDLLHLLNPRHGAFTLLVP